MASKEQATTLDISMTYTSGTAVNTAGCEAVACVLPVEEDTTITVTECATSGGTYTAVDEEFVIINELDTNLSKADNVVTASDASSASAIVSYVGKLQYVKFTVATAVADTSIGIIKGALNKSPVAPAWV